MRNMQALKGSIGVFALVFAASLLLLLPGCQGPLGLQDRANDTGTVSLTIEMPPIGRAIMPNVSLDDFTDFRLDFDSPSGGSYDYTLNQGAGNVTVDVELTLGTWTLVVTAYLSEDDYDDGYAAAASSEVTLTVTAGNVAVSGPVVLLPIYDGVGGLFTWALTFPDDGSTTTGTLEVFGVYDDGEIGDDLVDSATIPFTVTYMTLPAGTYFVLITLENDVHGELTFGIDLHIYGNMTSHLLRHFGEGRFRGCECDGLWMLDCNCDPCDCDVVGEALANLDNFFGIMGAGLNANNTRLVDGSLFLHGREDEWIGVDIQVIDAAGAPPTGPYQIPVGADTLYRVIVTGQAVVGTTAQLRNANTPHGTLNSVAVSGTANTVGSFTLAANVLGSVMIGNTPGVRIRTPDNDLGDLMIDTILLVAVGPCGERRVGGAVVSFGTPDLGPECDCGDAITMPLSDFISFGGLLANAARPAWYYVDGEVRVLTQGAFAAFGPFPAAAAGTVAWVPNDGDLVLQQAGRTDNWHGINIDLAALGIAAGDMLVVSGYAQADAIDIGWGRRMEINVAAGGGTERATATIGAAVGVIPFTLTWTDIPPADIALTVRIAGNGQCYDNTPAVGIPRFFITCIEVYRPDPAARFGNLPSTAATVNLAGVDPALIRFNTAVVTDVATITQGTMVTGHTTDGNFLIAADSFTGNTGTLFTITVPSGAVVGDVIHVAGRKGATGGDGNISIDGVQIAQGGQNIPDNFQYSEHWVRAITLNQDHITDGIDVTVNAWDGGTAAATRLNEIGFEIAIDQVVVIETEDPYITQRLALEAAIAAAERRVQQAYTTGTWTPFSTALANAVAGVADADGAALTSLTTALAEAQTALARTPADEGWLAVIASPYIGGRNVTPIATANGIHITARGTGANDHNNGMTIDITALRATYGSAVPIVITGYIAQASRLDTQGLTPNLNHTVTTAHGAFTVTIPAATVAAAPDWWGAVPVLGTESGRWPDMLVTGIQVGTESILDLLDDG